MGKLSRTKGVSFERWTATELRQLWPEAKRGWQAREGTEQCDVEGTPYWVECKRMKRVNVQAAVLQAAADTDGRPILVVHRDDHKPAMVTMHLCDWLEAMGVRWTPKTQDH